MAADPISDAVARIRAWGEARDWQAYDPYDALSSPLATPLSLGTALGRRMLTQVVKLSPVNLRPLLGVKPTRNSKAVALVASGYAQLAAATGDETARAEAERWLDWLQEHHQGGHDELAWGYGFDVQTRVFRYDRRTPNAIATSFAAQALMDGWELLGDEGRQAGVHAATRFLCERLHRSGRGAPYFAYLPAEDELVHNANLLVCAVFARASRLAGERSLFEPALDAVRTSLAAQRPDGSWPYAEQSGHRWVDNFHTGYVLQSLAQCAHALPEAGEALDRGLNYWERELFLTDGTPKYYAHRSAPEDAHCYATAIDTWVAVTQRRPDALASAEREARLLVSRMLDRRGYVHFQRRRLWTSRVPYVRWTTAPAFRALGGLLLERRIAAERPGGGG
jgi:hypothetical protein